MMKSFRAYKTNAVEALEQPMQSKLLLSGQELSMWFWQAMPSTDTEAEAYVSQDYEVMGYVVSGRAELHMDGKVIALKPGDSWVVPTGAPHNYADSGAADRH